MSTFPIEIQLRGMEPSESIEQQIRDWAAKLETTFARIQTCHVVVDLPHRHHHQGRRFHVRVSLTVPGETLVISNDPGVEGAHENAHVAVRDAFRAARRRLAIHAHAHDRDREAVGAPGSEP